MRSAARAVALAACALTAATACGAGDPPAAGQNGLRVVATTTHVADFARNVGGRRVEVRALLGPGVDPHDYEPRPGDVRAVAEAKLVLRAGGEVDAWMDELVASAGGDRPDVALIDSVSTIERPGAGAVDPHWWQDPRNAQAAVARIRDALTAADPGGRSEYRRNAKRYLDELRALDRRFAACMAGVPDAERKLVTTHDALRYFARRYDIEVVGAAIPALSTQAQPSAGETARLVRQIRAEGVRAIFAETGVSPKLERAIADEAGARLGRPLWADALGPPGSGAETYLRAMRANADAMVEGFSGGRRSCRD